MKHFLPCVLIFFSLQINGQYFSGGSGSVGDPYIIGNASDLIVLSQLDSTTADTLWTKNYILAGDIDFGKDETLVDWNGDGTADWNSEDSLGFRPIGFFDYGLQSNTRPGVKFSGNFIGNGKSINGLFINRPGENKIGLFGYVYYGSVKYLKLTNVDITGMDYVGGLVGDNGETNYGTINNCFTFGIVSYSGTEPVSPTVCGFVGGNPGTITSCYYNSAVATKTDTATGVSDIDLSVQSNFIGWDFIGEIVNGTDDYWSINSSINNGYPYLTGMQP